MSLASINTNSFGTASAIEDYVLWGASGIRDLTAENAGIWTDNDSIDVSGLGAGETVQLGIGLPGDSAADYTTGTGTLGSTNVPEPSIGLLALSGLCFLARRRRR